MSRLGDFIHFLVTVYCYFKRAQSTHLSQVSDLGGYTVCGVEQRKLSRFDLLVTHVVTQSLVFFQNFQPSLSG